MARAHSLQKTRTVSEVFAEERARQGHTCRLRGVAQLEVGDPSTPPARDREPPVQERRQPVPRELGRDQAAARIRRVSGRSAPGKRGGMAGPASSRPPSGGSGLNQASPDTEQPI